MECPNCGSVDLDHNEAGGNLACVSCGTVVEENTIVSSVEFQESGDRSHVMGQFVSANCSKPYNSATRSRGRYGNSRESRDATLAMARRNIAQVAGTLRLPSIYVDKAYRLYNLALQRGFIFGRRQMHVVATCLYTICRQEKSPHLLIDFSDALQVNVYILGKAFLQFTNTLSLSLPVVDPALYIHRFSARLDLGDKMQQVSTTALRIVTRLKKDWINLGRRPDGVCAAAMLLAARSQGFHKSQDEIAKIFRISCETLRKRLDEFAATPSAQLTIEEFLLEDDINEFDPPIFIENQIDSHGDNLELVLLDGVHETNGGEAESDAETDTMSTMEPGERADTAKLQVGSVGVSVPIPRLKRKVASQLKVRHVKTIQNLYDGIYAELDELMTSAPKGIGDSEEADGDEEAEIERSSGLKRLREEASDVNFTADITVKGNAGVVHVSRLSDAKKIWVVDLSAQGLEDIFARAKAQEVQNTEKLKIAKEKLQKTEKADEIEALKKEIMELEKNPSERYKEVPDSGFLPLDAEINTYLMSSEETQKRTEIRGKMYGGFMQERQRKKQEKQGREQEALQRATASGKTRGKKGAARSVSAISRVRAYAPTEPKRTSTKINYAKMDELYQSGARAVPPVPDQPTLGAAVHSGVKRITDGVPDEEEEEDEEDDERRYSDDEGEDEYDP